MEPGCKGWLVSRCSLTQCVCRLVVIMAHKRPAAVTFIAERPKSPRLTFDLVMVEDLFPVVSTATDRAAQLAAAVLKRNVDLTPSPEEQTHVTALVSQVQIVLETITLDQESPLSCPVDELRVVGSFKKGTMIRGKNEADIVLIARSVPTTDMISHLSERVSEELTKTNAGTKVEVVVTDHGFSIHNNATNASVRMLVTTHSVTRRPDGCQHVSNNLMQRHLAAIRHVRWFEGEHSDHHNVIE